MNTNRRSFLTCASLAAAGNALGLRPFGTLNAMAQSSSGYKALVCIFLFGGNDSNNSLVPFDTAGYKNYAAIRKSLALSQGSLLQLGPTPAFGLHPSLAGVASLYGKGNAAFLANVGTLIQPTSQAQYQTNRVITPVNLFSHPDQQTEWQSAAVSSSSTGWAGRIADRLTTRYNPNATVPMVTSIAGSALFGDGEETSAVSIASTGPLAATCGDGSHCTLRQQTAQQLSTLQSGVSLIQAENTITSNAATYNATITEALNGSTLQTSFPQNPFGAQLEEVARVIQARDSLSVNRQIFFVGAGNFDTHSGQLSQHATLLSQLDSALTAFYQATAELGIQDQVTTFTCSDFSRALQPNSANGTDHAWGGHHIILGGAVKGGKVYGTFPTLALGGPDDVGTNGRFIPSTSSAQYAATLAEWFGVAASDLPYVFPTINNFATSNLGFV